MKKAILRCKSIRIVAYQYNESDAVVVESYIKVSHIVPDYLHYAYKDFDAAMIELTELGFQLLSSTDNTHLLRFHKININELV